MDNFCQKKGFVCIILYSIEVISLFLILFSKSLSISGLGVVSLMILLILSTVSYSIPAWLLIKKKHPEKSVLWFNLLFFNGVISFPFFYYFYLRQENNLLLNNSKLEYFLFSIILVLVTVAIFTNT